jgi:hypothetical protein
MIPRILQARQDDTSWEALHIPGDRAHWIITIVYTNRKGDVLALSSILAFLETKTCNLVVGKSFLS